MSELHVKNHYVPQCYLKQWENSKRKIYAYRTLVSHPNIRPWTPYSAKSIAYHKYLYIRAVSGNLTDDLERHLDTEYESPAKEVITKVTKNQHLSPSDWHILIRFLAAQDVRTPARLVEHIDQYNKIVPKLIKEELIDQKKRLISGAYVPNETKEEENLPQNFIPIKVQQTKLPDKGGIQFNVETYSGRATWINSIEYLLENVAKVLLEHKWTIIKPAKGFNWFTSDNPVIRLNYKHNGEYDLNGGWSVPKGNIIFPISPEHAMFVLMGERPPIKGTRLNVEQTLKFREIIAKNAVRMIFSNSPEKDISTIRPRIVSLKKYQNEKSQWEKWHKENTKLEEEFFN